MRNTPKSIALLTCEYLDFRKLIVDQMTDVLNDAGFGVVCVTGKELNLEPKFHQDSTVCNSVHSAVGNFDLAGVILLSGSLANSATRKTIEEFKLNFSHLPVASFGMKLEGVPSVLFNETQSTQSLYEHAITEKRHKKIAFIRGTTNDLYWQDRERVFRDVAVKAGYTTQHIFTINGNYDPIQTFDGVKDLLDKHPEISLFAAANDVMAESAMLAVQAKKLRVPDDALIVGFDNTVESTRICPAITTVDIPIVDAAIACAQLLLDVIEHRNNKGSKQPSNCIELKTKFIRRGSTAVESMQTHNLAMSRHTLHLYISKTMLGLELPTHICMNTLCDALWSSIETDSNIIQRCLLDYLERSASGSPTTHWWNNLCHQLESIAEFIASDKANHNKSAVIIAAVSAVRKKLRDSSITEEFEKKRVESLRESMQLQMSSCVEEGEILDTMTRWLKQTQVKRCYLVRYTEPDSVPASQAQLIYAYENGIVNRQLADSYSSTQLLPDEYAHVIESGLVVQLPVYAGKNLFGYLLVDPSDQDYMYLDNVAQGIGSALRNQHLISQLEQQARYLKSSNQELVKLANYDELTELPNRLQFNVNLRNCFEASRRTQDSMTLFFIDLDGFKLVNDTLGHRAGDELLQAVAARLKSAVVDTAGKRVFIARLGGDEFTITLSSVHDKASVEKIANCVLKSLSQPYTISKRTINISASIGIANYPDNAETVEGLIKNADSAMYRAKEKGKNQVAWYTSELSVVNDTLLQMDNDMRVALTSGDICMHYQPRVNMNTGKVSAVEALMRWTIQTPDGRKIRTRPDIFIGVAEKTGFISKLDAFALDEACRQARAWELAGTPLLVAVNISVLHLQQDDFVQTVLETLSRYSLSSHLLELEITESAMMTQVEENVSKLHTLRRNGLQLSIDDFGTGYSSLSYLKQLPVNNLKIDKSFISDINSIQMRRSADAAIVKSVIALGHSMDFQIIAEGIETESQRQFLTSLGCHEAQGFLFAHPSPAADITDLLEQNAPRNKRA